MTTNIYYTGGKFIMTPTFAIIFTTAILIEATLIPTFILERRKKVTGNEWAIASRDLPLYVVVGTQFASVFGGGIMVGHLGNSYVNGIAVFIYGVFMVLPFVFLSIIANWLRKNQFATIPDIFRTYSNNNKTVVVVAAVMTMLFPIGWITSQITAFGSIYATLTGLNYEALCVIFSILSLLFIMPAGLKTVAWTDFFFACFMVTILFISSIIGTNMLGGVSEISKNVDSQLLSWTGSIQKLGVGTIFLWFFAVLPGGMTNQMYFQRICAINDEKLTHKSLMISAFVTLVAFGWAVYMGIAIHAMNPNLENSTATSWFMAQLPLWLLSCFAATLFAAMMSTVSSAVQSMVVNIVHDIMPYYKPDMTDKQSLSLSRILCVVIMVGSLVLCLKFTDTLTWLVAMNAFSAATLFCPIFLGYALRKKNFVTNSGIIASMVLGCIGTVIGMIMETAINYAAIGIAFSCVGMIVVSYFTRPKAN